MCTDDPISCSLVSVWQAGPCCQHWPWPCTVLYWGNMYSRTASDTLKLRRLINSLKDRGSELASELEHQSAAVFNGVQIVKSNNRSTQRFDSDDEDSRNE